MTAEESSTSDAKLTTACPNIAAALSPLHAQRTRSAYRLNDASLPQVVVDRSFVASDGIAAGIRNVIGSSTFSDCLKHRYESTPISLQKVTVSAVTVAKYPSAVGVLVRGIHGTGVTAEVVNVEVLVVTRATHVALVTLSSSGRNPIDAAVRDKVLGVLGAQ